MKVSGKMLLSIDRVFWLPYRLVSVLHNLFGTVFPTNGSDQGFVLVIKLMGLGSLIKFASMCNQSEVDKSKITLITFARHKEFCELFGFEKTLFIRTQRVGEFISDCRTILFFHVRTARFGRIVDFERCSNAVGCYRTLLAWAARCPTTSFEYQRSFISAKKTIFPAERLTLEELFLKGIATLTKSPKTISPRPVKKESNKVLININASDYLFARRYPVNSFASLIQSLHRWNPRLDFHLTGSSDETEYVGELLKAIPHVPAFNEAGKWDLERLISELSVCSLFITGDSGPLHLAAYMNVPTLALWGPTQPAHFGYEKQKNITSISLRLPCAPCFLHPASRPARSCHGQIDCLTNLLPAMIADKAMIELSDPAETRVIYFPEKMEKNQMKDLLVTAS